MNQQMFLTTLPIFLLCFVNLIDGAPMSHINSKYSHELKQNSMEHVSCPLEENGLRWIVNLGNISRSMPSYLRIYDVTKAFNGRHLKGLFALRNMSIIGLPQVASQTKLIFGPDKVHIRIPLENLVASGNYEISHGRLKFGLGDVDLWNGSLLGKGIFTLRVVNTSLYIRVGLHVQPETELISILVSKIELVAETDSVCDNVQVRFSNLTVNGSPYDERKYCHLAQGYNLFFPLFVTHQLNSFVEGCTLSDLRRILNRHHL